MTTAEPATPPDSLGVEPSRLIASTPPAQSSDAAVLDNAELSRQAVGATVSMRSIQGHIVSHKGKGVKATVSVQVDGDRSPVLGESNTDGEYALSVPATWLKLRVAAFDGEGRRGHKDVTCDANSLGAEIVDVVIARRVTFVLSMQIDESLDQALSWDGSASVVAHLAKYPRSSFVDTPDRELVVFRAHGGRQESRIEVDLYDENVVRWAYQYQSGRKVIIDSITIPAEREQIVVELGVTLDMCMMLLVLDTQREAAASGVPLVIMIDGNPQQRVDARSDANGRCVAIVPRGARGTVEMNNSPFKTTWNAGQSATLKCDLKDRLRLQLLDSEGSFVNLCSIAKNNCSLRGPDGAIAPISTTIPVTEGVWITEWQELQQGTRLFVVLPSGSECLYTLDRDIHAREGCHVLRLPSCRHGSVRLVCAHPDRLDGRSFVSLYMRENGDVNKPIEYRLRVAKSAIVAGWLAKSVLPGEYVYEVKENKVLMTSGVITIVDRMIAEIRIDR